mmetsp:Transcript_27505/g.31805  ORF Transcript_27505/g.31805 Transcript_27505/m.31805 type:complete len:156 (+) Transcript_27505:89-556(+)|eukprot:CAMPEP_0194361508 /NCGR_PEP_ID=MMETSP0174-20130528/9083_1 /TAXON_ID=216777 /ORGANISM="Proboscia alata, Strain PI-D3" /LENGTH=155 /DNA_ID=CAMNT_0039133753 /DNA_START=49 /DNA_END=516 /DNA_ORIENTATION=-
MNNVFQTAVNQWRMKPEPLTQNQQVARLYRKSLKVLNSWCIEREIFNEEGTAIRNSIEENRDCSANKASRLIREWEQKIQIDYCHPDPYCVPYMPGGTLFMRNPPIPMEVCFPDGNLPADAPKVLFNPDMTVCKKETGKAATGSLLVDFTMKSMY